MKMLVATLLGDPGSSHRDSITGFPSDPQRALQVYTARLNLWMSGQGFGPPGDTSEEEEELVYWIFSRMGIVWQNRAFFSTTGKHFVFAHKQVAAGDCIYALTGDPQFYCFRQRENGRYRLIGVAYTSQVVDERGFAEPEWEELEVT